MSTLSTARLCTQENAVHRSVIDPQEKVTSDAENNVYWKGGMIGIIPIQLGDIPFHDMSLPATALTTDHYTLPVPLGNDKHHHGIKEKIPRMKKTNFPALGQEKPIQFLIGMPTRIAVPIMMPLGHGRETIPAILLWSLWGDLAHRVIP